jgi:hypothetical protein
MSVIVPLVFAAGEKLSDGIPVEDTPRHKLALKECARDLVPVQKGPAPVIAACASLCDPLSDDVGYPILKRQAGEPAAYASGRQLKGRDTQAQFHKRLGHEGVNNLAGVPARHRSAHMDQMSEQINLLELRGG